MPTAPSASPSNPPATPVPAAVDPRGPRFAAVLSALVLAVVLITGSPLLAAAQAIVFAVGAFAGLGYAPYAVLYRTVLAGRLGPPSTLEPADSVRFAQGVGFAFAATAAVGYAAGLTVLGVTATAFALAAAALNAVFGVCLGCQLYLRLPVGLRRALIRTPIESPDRRVAR